MHDYSRFYSVVSAEHITYKCSCYCVKRSDVPRWKQGYLRPPPPYFIVLASSVKTKEVKVIEFHRIVNETEI